MHNLQTLQGGPFGEVCIGCFVLPVGFKPVNGRHLKKLDPIAVDDQIHFDLITVRFLDQSMQPDDKLDIGDEVL